MNTEQTMTPQRYQIIRKLGRHIPPGTIVVTRQGKWGNPFTIEDYGRATAVQLFAAMVQEGSTPPFTTANIRKQLAGKDVACSCPLDALCHGDVLLAVANAPSGQPAQGATP